MTLIELVVAIAVMGGIATVLAAAVTVTFRQQAGTEASVNVARWEQSLALWFPPDLASANPDPVYHPVTNPFPITGADTTDDGNVQPTPCGATVCGGYDFGNGSNVLMLGWNDGSQQIVVSYRYGPAADGDGFVLTRVQCIDGTCAARVVLRDLAPPVDAGWVPGDSVPASVVDVSVPTGSSGYSTVTVTVNGAPGADGVDHSSTVTVTAGGVIRDELAPPVFDGPDFIDARSGCGGPVTLIVDESGSIGDPVPVRQGVESFVRAFEGTPTKLQVLTMNNVVEVLDSTGSTAWNRFFDLSEPADVSELVGDSTLGSGGYLGQIGSGNSTDWEEAMHHAFYNSSGVTYEDAGNPNVPAPEMVVFFTDGLPTADEHSSGDPIPSDFTATSTGVSGQDSFSPRAWYRANVAADDRGEARIIGVGVGEAFGRSIFVDRSGWPRFSLAIPNRIFLGNLILGLSPTGYDGTQAFNTVDYDLAGSWADVDETTHVLTTGNMSQLGGGLAAIALAECGGTLTVQTRVGTTPADADVTYTVGSEQATTNRIKKAATFDIPLAGQPSVSVQLIPTVETPGFVIAGWQCRAGGADLPGSAFSVIGGDPNNGVNVTISANAAVSCTMQVTGP